MFIYYKKKTNKQIKNNVRPEPVRKCQSGKKKQNKRTTSPHQVKLRTKWPQNSSWSEEVSSCLHWSSAGYGREKHSQGQSQLLTAAPALQTRLWHFQLLISLITGQSWPAGARPCRSSPDLQHWTVCSSLMDYTGTLLVSLFVIEEKRLWPHAEKWASTSESCAKGSSSDLLWTVPPGKMFGHWTPFCVFWS